MTSNITTLNIGPALAVTGQELVTGQATLSNTSAWTNISDGTLTLQASITPTTALPNVLIMVVVGIINPYATYHLAACQILRGATPISTGTTSGSRTAASFNIGTDTGFMTYYFIDQPGVTTSTTYTVQYKTNGTLYLNYDPNYNNSATYGSAVSMISLVGLPAA